MELKVFNGEKFDRSKSRYIVFTSIFVLIFVLSAFYKNIVGIILMFFLLGAYIYYGIININEISIKISDNGLLVSDKIVPWSIINGFCLEINVSTQNIKNIVFVTNKGHNIYTIVDDIKNIELFLKQLEQIIPMLQDFPQTFWERVSRKMKL